MSEQSQEYTKGNNRNTELQVCPLCGATGKIRRGSNEIDIFGSASEQKLCPLCKGRGKALSSPRRGQIPFICPTRRTRLILRRPKLSKGVRPSLVQLLLPPPGTPLSGYPEGDMIPSSEQVVGHKQENSQLDTDSEADGNDITLDTGSNLEEMEASSAEPDLTNAIGEDSPSNLRADSGYEINTLHPVRGNFPASVDFIQVDMKSDDPDNTFEIPLSVDERVVTAPSLDVTEPPLLPSLDPLDVTGIPDPAGFQIDTDVTGQTGP